MSPGVAHERQAAFLQLKIERVQADVGQQRRQRPALRRAFLAGFLRAVLSLHRRSQVITDQAQDAFVTHLSADVVHQPVVVHVIEEALRINVHDPAFPCSHVGLGRSHRFMRGALRPEAVTVFAKLSLPERAGLSMEGLLDQSIQHRRDARSPGAAVRLRDVHRLDRFGPVTARAQSEQEFIPMRFDRLGGPGDRPSIRSCGPGVGFHLRPGRVQVLRRRDVLHLWRRRFFGAHRSAPLARGRTRPPLGLGGRESTRPPRPRQTGWRPQLSRPVRFGVLLARTFGAVRRSRLALSLRPFAPAGFPRRSSLLRPLLTSPAFSRGSSPG